MRQKTDHSVISLYPHRVDVHVTSRLGVEMFYVTDRQTDDTRMGACMV